MMDPPPKKLGTGPVSAILYAIHALGCTVKLDKPNLRILITPTTGPPIDLLHASRTAVGNAIRKWTRHTVLGELAAQVNCQTPRRKDMVGITAAVDVRTTQSTLRAKTSPIDNLPLRLFNQLLLSVLAGSIRAGDRIAHADNTAKDACIHCGVRHTTHHLLWECNQGQRARQPYLDKMNRIQAIAEQKWPADGTTHRRPTAQHLLSTHWHYQCRSRRHQLGYCQTHGLKLRRKLQRRPGNPLVRGSDRSHQWRKTSPRSLHGWLGHRNRLGLARTRGVGHVYSTISQIQRGWPPCRTPCH